jgi:hypothetical protein
MRGPETIAMPTVCACVFVCVCSQRVTLVLFGDHNFGIRIDSKGWIGRARMRSRARCGAGCVPWLGEVPPPSPHAQDQQHPPLRTTPAAYHSSSHACEHICLFSPPSPFQGVAAGHSHCSARLAVAALDTHQALLTDCVSCGGHHCCAQGVWWDGLASPCM